MTRNLWSLLSLMPLAVLPNFQFVFSNSQYPNYIIRPHITRLDYKITIDAKIGTPSINQTFVFDTASPLTWTQCKPCINCFAQKNPLFDPKNSKSYKKLDQNHSLSDFFNTSGDGSFVYKANYLTGQSSSGIVALETFSFPSDKRAAATESIKNIVFGCANNNVGTWPNNTVISGILGMNRSPLSLISQMGVEKVKRFSYCLPKLSSAIKKTYLRFGNDVKTRGNLKKTKLWDNTYKYMAGLQGVSISGRRLKLPKGTFSNGCMLDTGHSGSKIDSRAYTEIVKIMAQHFDRFKLTRLSGRDYEGQLCYRELPGFSNFPNMTFHFKGTGWFGGSANLEIGHENLFGHEGDKFCMVLYGLNNMSILGAFQMQNVRFVYDLWPEKKATVSFGAEDCSLDKA